MLGRAEGAPPRGVDATGPRPQAWRSPRDPDRVALHERAALPARHADGSASRGHGSDTLARPVWSAAFRWSCATGLPFTEASIRPARSV